MKHLQPSTRGSRAGAGHSHAVCGGMGTWPGTARPSAQRKRLALSLHATRAPSRVCSPLHKHPFLLPSSTNSKATIPDCSPTTPPSSSSLALRNPSLLLSSAVVFHLSSFACRASLRSLLKHCHLHQLTYHCLSFILSITINDLQLSFCNTSI